MIEDIVSYLRSESGATSVEYVLLASLVAVAIAAAVTNVGSRLSQQFSEISSTLP